MPTDGLLASNKLATAGSAAKAHRRFDVLLSDYGDGAWSALDVLMAKSPFRAVMRPAYEAIVATKLEAMPRTQ